MPERRRGARSIRIRALLLVLATWLLALPALAAAAPRIGLLTMSPGDEYWARFGHNAILVAEPDGRATSYNFGFFDFEQQDFLLRFLRGRMLYKLVALPAERDIGHYAAEGRGVRLQWLDIAPPAARELADRLAWQARPENADYRYDYFSANCSTKVRDALDEALGGELLRQTRGRSRGLTARSESLRLAKPLPWLWIGIHFGLGPATDRVLTRWHEGFVPGRLEDAVREVRLADGRPLVLDEQQLVEARLPPAPDEPPRALGWFAAGGAALAMLLAVGLRRPAGAARRAAAWTTVVLWTIGGLLGLGLAGLWLFTDHTAAWGNRNLLLVPPLLLLLLPALPALRAGRPVPRWLGVVGLLAVASATWALAEAALSLRSQQNGEWIALLLPLHAVLAERLWRQGRRRDEPEPEPVPVAVPVSGKAAD